MRAVVRNATRSAMRKTNVGLGPRVVAARGKSSVPAPNEEVEPATQEAPASGDLSKFQLAPRLRTHLEKLGIKELFPVQVATFESVRNNQDMIVRSRTGSGKTMAFALPVVDRIIKRQDANPGNRRADALPHAVVVAPTRELALQVQKEIARLAPGVKCVSVYGGAAISGQVAELRKGADVVVGTPGRMLDLISRGILRLSAVETAVLDEADEMLKMGFVNDIEAIFNEMPSKDNRQTLMFSATVAPEVRRIAQTYMRDTTMIDLVGEETNKVPDGIEMISMCCASVPHLRHAAIAAVLEQYCEPGTRALLFAPMKSQTIEIAQALASRDSPIKCAPMNGDMSQKSREETLDRFRNGQINCLVATDVAARGLDIPNVDLVLHHGLPLDLDSFVHRTGRTGRAGRAGRNVVLFDIREKDGLYRVEEFCGAQFKRRGIPSMRELVQRRRGILEKRLESLSHAVLVDYQSMAYDLLVARLSNPATVPENVKQEAAGVVAKALALAGSGDSADSFSALTGSANRVTLVLRDVPRSHHIKPVGRGSHQTLTGRDYWSVREVVDEIVKQTLLEAGSEKFNSLQTIEGVTSAKGDYVLGFEIASDLSVSLLDVHPVVANILLSQENAESKGAQGSIEPLVGDLPNMLRVHQVPGATPIHNRFGNNRGFKGRFEGNSYGGRQSGGGYGGRGGGRGGSRGGRGGYGGRGETSGYGGRGAHARNGGARRGNSYD